MKKCLLLALTVLGSLALSAGELRFSGVLGQSQPPGSEPVPSVGMKGVAFDKDGRLYSFPDEGRRLLRFVRQGRGLLLDKAFEAPSSPGPGVLQADANRLLYPGSDGSLVAFDPESSSFSKLCALPKGTSSFQVAQAPFGKSWRCLALASGSVWARGLGGEGEWSKLFDVKEPSQGGRFECVGIEPSSGDVLLGNFWPSQCVSRFSLDGREIVNSSWPRTATQTKSLALMDGVAWSMGGFPCPVPPSASQLPAFKIPLAPWTSWTNGLARGSGGELWIACSQGLLGFDKKGHPLELRAGGTLGPKLMACAGDGTLVAYDNFRMLRLMIDDEPDSPLACAPNEPFRVGANWKSHAAAMQFDGAKFIVLDDAKGQLWAFDPWHTGYKEDTWLPLCPEGAFKKPKGLALVGSCVFVSGPDGLFVRRNGEESFSKLGIELGGQLAGGPDGLLFGVSGAKLRAFDFSQSPEGAPLWDSAESFTEISAFAAGQGVVAVADSFGGRVCVLSARDGRTLASLSCSSVPGGLSPSSIAVSEPWIFVGDSSGRRIVRLRLR